VFLKLAEIARVQKRHQYLTVFNNQFLAVV